MSKWIKKFLEKDPQNSTDNTDRFNSKPNMSVLSVPTPGHFGKSPFTFSNGAGLLEEYEERLAIAEYDGHQNSIQAQRIAYLDAFIAVLVTLPYDNVEGDWLSHRVKAAQARLSAQRLEKPI